MGEGLTDAEAAMIVERFLAAEPWVRAIFPLVVANDTLKLLRDALSGASVEDDAWSARAGPVGIVVASTPRGPLAQPVVIGWPEVSIYLRRSLGAM
jgi:hypothetical protein